MDIDTVLEAPPAWWAIIEIQRSESPVASMCSMRPMAASMRSSTCGPVSSSTSRSTRQGVTLGVDVLDATQGGNHEGEDVRADVEQRTPLHAPGRGEGAAGQGGTGDEAGDAASGR